jgi:hypothetical protein
VTPRQRLALFCVAAAGLVGCYLWAFTGLPGFGKNVSSPGNRPKFHHKSAKIN